MNEFGLVEIIKNLSQSSYIGDDCAYLEDLGIVVSQDSLVEDVHFRLSWMSPKELGVKSALVNISDVIASGAKPVYISVSLSLPREQNEKFVTEFYEGLTSVCKNYDVKIIGGDLTGSDKVFVSVTIIGKVSGHNISSRKNAKSGYNVWVYGEHGSSAAGLRCLEKGLLEPKSLINAHKKPKLCSKVPMIVESYAMMDTSDGLVDALYKIAIASGVTLKIDFDKIPFNSEIKVFEDYEDLILYGGEDYGLVAVVPQNYDLEGFAKIGSVIEKTNTPLIINKQGAILQVNSIEEFTFNHF